MCGVMAWVAIGFFVAWIGTKVEAHGPAGGIANIGVGVLGALVGGFATRVALGGRTGFNAFCVGALAALIVAAAFITVASQLGNRRVPRH
jgi:uncharacterized membrane protein YeaQ/YmgE (transglycosylase-associated protein family)